MIHLEHRELSIEALGEIMRDAALLEARSAGVIHFFWTDLPTLQSTVLNILTPQDTVMWNLWPYRAMLAGQLAYQAKFLHPERRRSTHSTLAAYIRKAGHKKRSDFAHSALGGWTWSPEFESYDEPTLLDGLGLRQISLVMPAHQRSAVRQHFNEQFEYFGESCLAALDETAGSGEFDDLRETAAGRLLLAPLVKLNDEQLSALLKEAEAFRDDQAIDDYVEGLDIRFGLRGLFTLFPDVDQFRTSAAAELLILRARIAARACRLPALENLMEYVGNPVIDGHAEPLRSQLVGILSTPLQASEKLRGFTY